MSLSMPGALQSRFLFSVNRIWSHQIYLQKPVCAGL